MSCFEAFPKKQKIQKTCNDLCYRQIEITIKGMFRLFIFLNRSRWKARIQSFVVHILNIFKTKLQFAFKKLTHQGCKRKSNMHKKKFFIARYYSVVFCSTDINILAKKICIYAKKTYTWIVYWYPHMCVGT